MKIKVGEITKIKTGKLDANAASADGEYPFFTCSKDPLKIDTYSYDCECVLVAGNGDLNVKYYNGKFDAYQRTYIIENNSNGLLYMPYLYYFLEGYIEELRKQSIGGVIKYIKIGNLTEASIELPPIEEQKYIVHLMNISSELIELRKKTIDKLNWLIKARFVEMFGNVPEEERVTIAEICKIITDGTHQPPKFTNTGIPFLFVSNIITNEICYDAEKFISEETYTELIKRTPIEIGDILLSTVGSYGHPAIVKTDRRFCFQRHIAYLKPKSDMVNSEYLRGAILSDNVQRQIDERVKGIAQKTLNLAEIRKIRLPLPPLKLQEQFADFVKQVDKSKLAVQKSLEKTQQLFDSLMQEYFG
ncbi:hypothetical protein B5F14_08395 [Faecalitalea cylindroides]|uniref:Type I restriction modification DNA specificity domain-containing protein n=1 Tax=Faecalitalea cylindroides TaxID=39483 RepID=A0A1Y4LN00_9FIRM|nr:restriction endonuclease subunit S [Faecalitalea cylindroides]OUP58066.1 hypothetical protein B5F14_08395 [Faecalitalea cylindroides]